MTTSRYPDITDELLSAYIDGAVTGAEQIAVEQAVQDDPNVAWRLSTLQETVHLLRSLPAMQAPRSFVLTAEQLGKAMPESVLSGSVALERAPVARAAKAPAADAPGFWMRMVDGWRGFWQGGSPALRNAMAASMAALLLLLIVPSLLSTPADRLTVQSQPAPAGAAIATAPDMLAAKEEQSRDNALARRPVPAGEAAAETSGSEASEPELSEGESLPGEEAAVVLSVTPVQAAQDMAADEAAVPTPETVAILAAPPAALSEQAEPAMAAAVPPAALARVVEGQPGAAAAAAAPESAAAEDALAFAPSAAMAAQPGDAASLAAAPAAVDQVAGSEASAPAATLLPEGAADGAAVVESLPAEPAQESAPVAEAPAAPLQPESPAIAAVPAPAATQVQLPSTAMERTAAATQSTGAVQPPPAPVDQDRTWVWAQLLAASAVVLFGFLWWRSRRAA